MKCREVFLSVDANADFKAGREFYDLNSKKAGDYFVAGILSDLESLSFYAGIHPLFSGFHRMLARRFPFAIYYEIHEEQVWVVAILDMRKKPDGIIEKLKSVITCSRASEESADYKPTLTTPRAKPRRPRK